MSYGVEAVIPIETGFTTLRTHTFNPNDNDSLLERSLNLIEKRRENAMVQLDRKSTRLNSSHCVTSRMPSSA